MKQNNLYVTRRTIDLATGHYSKALSDPAKDSDHLRHIIQATEYLQEAKRNLRQKIALDSVKQVNNKLKLGGAKGTADFMLKMIELPPDKKAQLEKLVGVTPKISRKSSGSNKKSSEASASSDKSTDASESTKSSSSSMSPGESKRASESTESSSSSMSPEDSKEASENAEVKNIQKSMKANGIDPNKDFATNTVNSSKSPLKMIDSKIAKGSTKNNKNSAKSASNNE